MCNASGGFKFCACMDDFETRQKNYKYTWTLQKLVGAKSEINRRGKIVRPTSDLGDGITQEETLKELEENNCFDFEYFPGENDTLHISTFCEDQRIKYFSLIFKNGAWTVGNNAFSPKETIKEGYIKKTET